jgi:peptidoglycan/LPS O-acetylase OafA/YrhL
MSESPGIPGGTTTLSNADQPDGRRRRRTIGQVFDGRRNALNAWRLTLALGVIVWHSYKLTGRDVYFPPARQLISEIWVDGFFAISGFLITSSWLRDPRMRDYVVARGLRILPGFHTCLIVTAFVIAPVGVTIQGGSGAKLLLSRAPFEYVVKNSAVSMLQFDIGGTPHGIPWPGAWDGSLWTLGYEMFCYVAVAALGVVGLLSRRWLLPAVMGLCFPAVLLSTVVGLPTIAHDGLRFVVMFVAGALLNQYRDVIPARWSLVAVSVVIVLVASLLPDYRLVAALPLAYAIIVSGALVHSKRFRLRTDLSYGMYIYAFPIQQLLVICGLGSMNLVVFAVIATVATLPLAALSWFVIEKPAMSLKSRLKRKGSVGAVTRQPGQTVSGGTTG